MLGYHTFSPILELMISSKREQISVNTIFRETDVYHHTCVCGQPKKSPITCYIPCCNNLYITTYPAKLSNDKARYELSEKYSKEKQQRCDPCFCNCECLSRSIAIESGEGEHCPWDRLGVHARMVICSIYRWLVVRLIFYFAFDAFVSNVLVDISYLVEYLTEAAFMIALEVVFMICYFTSCCFYCMCCFKKEVPCCFFCEA